MAIDFLQQYLGGRPDLQYQQALTGLGIPQSRFFQNRYGNVYGQYLNALQKQGITGPYNIEGKFGGFLDAFDWQKEFERFTPNQRGEYPYEAQARTRLAPRTRFLNF